MPSLPLLLTAPSNQVDSTCHKKDTISDERTLHYNERKLKEGQRRS